MKRKPNGIYSGRVIVGRTPEGRPIRRTIQAGSSIEFLKLRYQMRYGIVAENVKTEVVLHLLY